MSNLDLSIDELVQLLEEGRCTPGCLFARERGGTCTCRCQGVFHQAFLHAISPVFRDITILRLNDPVAIGCTGKRCPVGWVTGADNHGIRIDLLSFATGTRIGPAIALWKDVEQILVSSDLQELGAFQGRWQGGEKLYVG